MMTGCGDGSLLLQIYDFVKQRTPRGQHLEDLCFGSSGGLSCQKGKSMRNHDGFPLYHLFETRHVSKGLEV